MTVSTSPRNLEDEPGTVGSVEELARLVGDRRDLYLRWSRGPEADAGHRSRDALTGVELPGLSVNALAVEPWWGARSREVWVARRLYDYQHLQHRGGRRRSAWVFTGRECGRGPDNEPLIDQAEPVARVDRAVVDEARQIIETLADDWGSLARTDPDASGPAR